MFNRNIISIAMLVGIAGCAVHHTQPSATPVATLDPAKASGLAGLSDLPLDEVEKRVAAGDVKALVELGSRYGTGNGVEKSYDRALGFLRAAAAKGDPDAQFFIGTAYSSGFGVEIDEVTAISWYELAAAQHHPAAEYWLAIRIIKGIGGIVPSWPGAIPYLWDSAAKGYTDAELMLGYAYESGNGVSRSPQAAAYWYRRLGTSNLKGQIGLANLIRSGSVPWEESDPVEYKNLAEQAATTAAIDKKNER